MAEAKVFNDGPYLISGDVTLVDADGNAFKLDGQFALCRCGHSENKPFCDGQHAKQGFQSELKAR